MSELKYTLDIEPDKYGTNPEKNTYAMSLVLVVTVKEVL